MKHYIDSEKGVSARARRKSSANSQHLFHQDFWGIKVADFIRIISEKSGLKLEKNTSDTERVAYKMYYIRDKPYQWIIPHCSK